MMIICKNCGSQNSNRATKCKYCGRFLTGNTVGNVTGNVTRYQNDAFCKYCGHALPLEAVFCSNCGRKIRDVLEAQNNYTDSTDKRYSKHGHGRVFLACIVAIVVIIVLGSRSGLVSLSDIEALMTEVIVKLIMAFAAIDSMFVGLLFISLSILAFVIYHKIFTVYYFDLFRGIMSEIVSCIFVGYLLTELAITLWWLSSILLIIISITISKRLNTRSRKLVISVFAIFAIIISVHGLFRYP